MRNFGSHIKIAIVLLSEDSFINLLWSKNQLKNILRDHIRKKGQIEVLFTLYP